MCQHRGFDPVGLDTHTRVWVWARAGNVQPICTIRMFIIVLTRVFVRRCMHGWWVGQAYTHPCAMLGVYHATWRLYSSSTVWVLGSRMAATAAVAHSHDRFADTYVWCCCLCMRHTTTAACVHAVTQCLEVPRLACFGNFGVSAAATVATTTTPTVSTCVLLVAWLIQPCESQRRLRVSFCVAACFRCDICACALRVRVFLRVAER